MSGERPVPTGKQTCSSDRNQYLETGELNDEEDSRAQLGQNNAGPPGIERNPGGHNHDDPHIPPPRIPGHRGHGERNRNRDRVERDWDSQSSKYYGGRAGGYPESDDEPPYTSRPWSRNDYYGREPTDYYRRPQRDPYYEDYNRHRPRDDYDYGRMGYPRSQRGWEYMADPNTSRHGHESFNMSRGLGRYGGPSQNQVNPNSREILEYLEELRITNRASYRKWYEKYMVHHQNPTKIPFPIPPGFSMHSSQYPGGNMSMHQSNLRQGYLEGASHISGRSSVNNEELRRSFSSNVSEVNSTAYDQEPLSLPNFGFQPIDSSNLELDNESSRSTPQKFISGHALAVLSPLGQLLKVSNGGPVVEVSTMKQVMKHLPEFDEIEAFSGPLVKGKTHKNSVIKFCQKKIKEAQSNLAQVDRENFILIWELLILLLKQNGSVVGSDIAELLLKKDSEENLADDAQGIDNESDSTGGETVGKSMNEIKSTQKFCDLLLFGHQKDALEMAMVNGLWGHALFLASKMGEKEYGHVLARFANGLSFNHPLQTLYQILSGKQPSSVTCCTDESFGDWRPHLSMILSNSGYRADLEHKTIVTLGDTLYNGNFVYAAQFCYLMAQVEFSHTSKLGPLLGLSPGKENVIEATQMTEIYEFARSLAEPNATLGITFLQHKFEYTKVLVDFGFVQESFAYCEQIARHLLFIKSNHQENVEALKWATLQISERLKCCEEQDAFGDPQWMRDIRSSINGEIPNEDSTRKSSISSTAQSISRLSTVENHNQNIPSDIPQYKNDLNIEYNSVTEQAFTPESNNQDLPAVAFDSKNQFTPSFTQPTSTNEWSSDGYQQQTQQPYENLSEQMEQITISSAPPPMYNPTALMPNSNNWSQPQPPNGPLTSAGMNNYNAAPLISGPMSNGPLGYDQVGNSNSAYNPSNANEQPHYLPKIPDLQQSQQQVQPAAPEPKSKTKSNDGKSDKDKKSTSQGGTGFLGSIFGRFKDKTQMKLPDDKNPSIVWDDVKKQWVNKGGEDEDETPQTGPPPSDMQLRMQMNQPSIPTPNSYQQPTMINTNGQTPFPPNNNNLLPPNGTGLPVSGMPQLQGMPNKYSLQKGRSLKNSYVDVLKPNVGSGTQISQMPMMKSEQQQQMLPPPLFTPAPAPIPPEASESGPTSFLTPASYGNGVPSQFSNTPSQSYPPY